MAKSLEKSGDKITQLSSSVTFFKDIIHDTRKAIVSAEKSIDMLENKYRHLEDIISAKDRKIIALVDQILSNTKHSDVTIEPEIYSSTYERKLWAKRRNESEYDLETRKKYTFRLTQ
ncbi:2468_t:CDS:1 [Paraglomus brasilianum]|uniref:2468_t:CDS:1 n=1 Tax=Paraglomus brasilianum TaxID=144538 RepID=A0A9N9A760_9GLOM|nr:2468_t:CDS:1 [Paraglomus brasilianum]